MTLPTPPRWFEFLLQPEILTKHLETKDCDPSPTDLIDFFFRNLPSVPKDNNISSPPNGGQIEEEVHIPPDSYQAQHFSKKSYALKTLAIKVACFLAWDLDRICSNLSIATQHALMQAFVTACSSPKCPDEMRKFSEILCCQWYLRSAIAYKLLSLQPQSNNATIIYLSPLQQQQQAADAAAFANMGKLFAHVDSQWIWAVQMKDHLSNLTTNQTSTPNSKKQANRLHEFDKAKLLRPKPDCFDHRTEQYNDWQKSETNFDKKGFLDSACYDLGRFYFFVGAYGLSRQVFEKIERSDAMFPKLKEYLKSSTDMDSSGECDLDICMNKLNEKRLLTEKYLFDCMERRTVKSKPAKIARMEPKASRDIDLRIQNPQMQQSYNNSWLAQQANGAQPQQLMALGDMFMSQGNFNKAMGCFIESMMLITDYFRYFSKSYNQEEPYIARMIQCSISLGCFTQAVALCQMTENLNYTLAIKQLNERICNDCCDDIYECIWDVTLLEYIINLHSRRGEVERRTKVIQLIGQLELNENNSEEILREAEHVRRGRFFRIMSNKYL